MESDERFKWMLPLGIPKLYLRARLSDFPSQNISPEELEGTPGFSIFGPTGSGKTHLAVALLKEWLKSNRATEIYGQRWNGTRYEPKYRDSAKFITSPELLMDIRRSIGTRMSTVHEMVVAYIKPVALVIDDFGAEKATDWSAETFYLILNRRLNDMMPTIVTSNYSLDEIQESDPRIASRLAGLDVIQLQGRDRRIEMKSGPKAA